MNFFGLHKWLIWQLNDCWPGTSWFLIDYFLLPKASYSYAVDFKQNKKAEIWVVNDTLEPFDEKIMYSIFDFDEKEYFTNRINVKVQPNEALKVAEVSEEQMLCVLAPERAVLMIQTDTVKKMYFLRDHKDLELPEANFDIRVDRKRGEGKIKANTFSRMVKLEMIQDNIKFSDNYFNFMPKNKNRSSSACRTEGTELGEPSSFSDK